MSNAPRPTGLRRRHWLIAAPLGAIALGGVFTLRRSSSNPTAAGTPFAASLGPGQALDGWTVVRVHPLRLGAVAVVLETGGGLRYQVDVLARDGQGPDGVANTDELSLFVINSHDASGADGVRSTDEDQGLGAMALARALAAESVPRGLLTLAQRREQHPTGAFAVPLA